MQKALKYLVILFFSFFWLIGCSKDLSKYLFDNKFLNDDYRYGDLYRLSNLPDFKVPVDVCSKPNVEHNQAVNLYLAGDSFTEDGRIDSSYFVSNKLIKGKVFEENEGFVLNTNKNVLIIETVERHFRERFAVKWQKWKPLKQQKQTNDFSFFNLDKLARVNMPYNKEMHEAAVFGSDFFLFFKGVKAKLNQKVFGKIDEKVRLSADGKHLLYYLDVEEGISSSFSKIEEKEIHNLIKNVNETRDYYKSIGFDEVYISIIPNKTSILGRDLGQYNSLIKRIENDSRLKTPIISIISEFEKGKDKLYDKGDTHWNCAGKKIWTDKVNYMLTKF